jgi:hypothetical protein
VLDGAEEPEHCEARRSGKAAEDGGDPHATVASIAGADGEMTIQQLENLCDELLLQPNCESSELLAALSDTELQDAYLDVLRQYGLELVIGAEDSGWMSDLLVIGNNQGAILACQTAFAAVLLEMSRRGVERPDEAAALRKAEAQLETEQ